MKNKFLVIIAGPTAVGKTRLSIEIAGEYSSEIISADSRQIYREMRIGTAVPSEEQLRSVKHHFIQAISIHDNYNAAKYETEVINLLDELFLNHPVLFLTGGSGLYIDAVCSGIDEFPDSDPDLRKNLVKKLHDEGIESLRRDLKILDPESYARIDLRNSKRIQKALEISIMTGKPYSSFLSGKPKERPFNIIRIALDMNRDKLYERINRRTAGMMNDGLGVEARELFPFRYINALNTVGYKEMFDYFDGKTNLQEAVAGIQANTRKYARKQLTWFRKNNYYQWFNPEDKKGIMEYIKMKMKKPK